MILKKVILLIVAISLLSCDQPQTMHPYELALIKAEKERKYILLDFMAVWCGGCKAYDKYIFADNKISERILEKFIILKINVDKPESDFVVQKYKISGLPHLVLIDGKEQLLGSIIGFDSKYSTNSRLFTSDLEKIIESKEKIKKLESIFHSDTTNAKAIKNLLKEYQLAGKYISAQKMKVLLLKYDPTPERLFEYNFNEAIHSLESEKNPDSLLSFLRRHDSLDKVHFRLANTRLLYYYESLGDLRNQDYYYQELLKIDPIYYKMKYARFLFENNLKIDTAIAFTNQLLLNEEVKSDHWGQFLKAHLLVNQGKKKQAVLEYRNWMEQNINRWQSGETYWLLYFYARFANYYHVDLEKALEYIKICVEKRDLVEDKILMTEISYELGDVEFAVEKLMETLNYIDDKNENERISKLIDEYKKELKN